jgi:hypothetical protein
MRIRRVKNQRKLLKKQRKLQ